MLVNEITKYKNHQLDEGILDWFRNKKQKTKVPKTPQEFMEIMKSYAKPLDMIQFDGKRIDILTKGPEASLEEISAATRQLKNFRSMITNDQQEIGFLIKQLKTKGKLDNAGRVPLVALGGSKRMMMLRTFIGLFRTGKRQKLAKQVVNLEQMQDLGQAVIGVINANIKGLEGN